MKSYKKSSCSLLLILLITSVFAQKNNGYVSSVRAHISLDTGWRFAYGHPYDPKKDFNNGTGYFSYLAKASYGDGAASQGFDDRAWRKLNIPHDWAVEQPFDMKASFSHGFKAIGRNFPDASVGWYRKSIIIPNEDLGKKISIAFDGIFRNSIVWVNGHYLGNEPSGYQGFEYDITDYINYGGENVIAVRVDVTMEEGWFYEGAGIYRHVWLNKTNPLHMAPNGIFVHSNVVGDHAEITMETMVKNDAFAKTEFDLKQEIVDQKGQTVGSASLKALTLQVLEEKAFKLKLNLPNPQLWDLEHPHLYRLRTTISKKGEVLDVVNTFFGIRTIHFDANRGFFLNGKRIQIKGTNNHQDHAGVGVALPDELQYFRIAKLKELGSNAYRCSHNPPTVELLEACDRLGMLVIDENRLMGINNVHLNDVKRMIMRDRNHPSIISWSIGNEEWGIEGNLKGARIAKTMQAFVKTIDTSRAVTAAISAGIGNGISTVIDLLGYNYIATKNTDEQHRKYPSQFSWGTEEGSTVATRGIYVNNNAKNELAAYDVKQNSDFLSLEDGWKHYAARPYLAGMFIWTGFDYRGEPTPFGWPSVLSYFGMLDLCGFPKDSGWYLKSWWTDQPTLHLLPHWNWKGMEGKEIDVWAYSNCDEVELFLNSKSLGKKKMERNGHLSWKVSYAPGTVQAIGFKNGKKIASDIIKTTAEPTQFSITQENVQMEKPNTAVITVKVMDEAGNIVPTANNQVNFTIDGPAKIIGVGNGNPTSLEADQFIDQVEVAGIVNLREKMVTGDDNIEATLDDEQGYSKAFTKERDQEFGTKVKSVIYKGEFVLPEWNSQAKITLFYKSIGQEQSIFINGKRIALKIPHNKKGNSFLLDGSLLRQGKNMITITATPILKTHRWDVVNMDPGVIQIFKPALAWHRKLFSGAAQVIIQKTGDEGKVILKASSEGLKSMKFTIR